MGGQNIKLIPKTEIFAHVVPIQSGEDDLSDFDPGVDASGQGTAPTKPTIVVQSALDAVLAMDPDALSDLAPPKNPEEKDFLINTGFEQSKPLIILSTEFLPLFGSIETSTRDYALNVKEKSEILTALNAFNVLSQNEQTPKILSDNKDALIKFSKDQSLRIKSLIQTINASISALNVKYFSHMSKPVLINKTNKEIQQNNEKTHAVGAVNDFSIASKFKNKPQFTRMTMADYLRDAGWGEEAKKLSPTALYQQFILELKRSLLTHSPYLLTDPPTLGSAPVISDFRSAYELRGLFNIAYNSKTHYVNIEPIDEKSLLTDALKLYYRAHFATVPANNQPSIIDLTEAKAASDEFFATIDAEQLLGLFGLPSDPSTTFVNYDLNGSQVIIKRILGAQAKPPPSMFMTFLQKETSIRISNLQINSPHSSDHRVKDPVVISTLLSREISYSTTLSNPDFITNLSDRGFTVSKGLVTVLNVPNNIKVWDFIIGSNFVKDTLDMSSITKSREAGSPNLDPTLLGLSKTKYQLGGDNKNKYGVLTFETNDMPLVNESLHNLTHGAYFYIDSSLNTTNFENFDTTRLDSLILDLEKANESNHLIKKLYTGLPKSDDSPTHELLFNKRIADPDPIDKLVSLTSSIFDIYKKFLNINSAGKLSIDAAKRQESFYIKDSGLLPDAAAIVTASIFKLAARSTNSPGGTEQYKLRRKLNLCLFHILMREARKLLEVNYSVDYNTVFEKVGRFTAATSKEYGVELSSEINNDLEPDVNILVWSEAKYDGKEIGDDLREFAKDQLLGNPSSPEQAVDFLLMTLIGHNGSLTSINATNLGQACVPLIEAANVGFGAITVVEGSEDPELAAAVAAQGFIKGQQEVTHGDSSTTLSTRIEAGGMAALGGDVEKEYSLYYNASEDKVKSGDDPTVLAVLGSPESYFGKLGTGISSDAQGLFQAIRDLMVELLTRPIFDAQIPNNLANISRTRYNQISNGEMCWFYFNLICDFFAAVVPDSFDGTFSTVSIADVRVGGYKLKLDQSELDEKFTVQGDTFISNFIDDFSKRYYSEQIRQANSIDILDKFIKNALNKLNNFRDNLSSNFGSYLSESRNVLGSDGNLNPAQRVALANMSFSREQLVLSDYILSEILDRFDTKNESESKLRTLPEFKNYPSPFIDYAPFTDLDLTSYTTLSPFFKTFEGFAKEKSNNARILSIGMPPRMLRNLIGEPSAYELESADRARSNVVRLKIYKNDILNSGIVFQPLEYLFEVNRFPTKIVSNWDSLLNFNGLNFKSIPTKYWDGSKIVLHKNFDQAFSSYGNFLTDFERQVIYLNHVYSQLIEEYINWFSGNRVDESRYTHYTGMSDYLNNQVMQFQNYLKTTGNKFDLQNLYKQPANVNTQGQDVEKIVKNLENTVKRYLNNETLLMDLNDYKRKILYPKKFDRVFNVIFDPDFFRIVTFADEVTKNKYVNAGLVSPTDQSLWIRNTQQSDIYLEEYWATIEPYDITNEI